MTAAALLVLLSFVDLLEKTALLMGEEVNRTELITLSVPLSSCFRRGWGFNFFPASALFGHIVYGPENQNNELKDSKLSLELSGTACLSL